MKKIKQIKDNKTALLRATKYLKEYKQNSIYNFVLPFSPFPIPFIMIISYTVIKLKLLTYVFIDYLPRKVQNHKYSVFSGSSRG
jgi:hypothetical protein